MEVDIEMLWKAIDRKMLVKKIKSLSSLAREIGISVGVIKNIKIGISPDVNKYLKLTRWLEVNPNRFFIGKHTIIMRYAVLLRNELHIGYFAKIHKADSIRFTSRDYGMYEDEWDMFKEKMHNILGESFKDLYIFQNNNNYKDFIVHIKINNQ